jgi:hypothetical protein
MNQNLKRGRGRPVGTGIDDEPALARIADMIVANPSLRPTTAIKRVLDKPEPSIVRRLQVKWKEDAVGRLAAARARRDAPAPRRAITRRQPRALRQMAEAQSRVDQVFEVFNSPDMVAARETMRRIYESPDMLAAQEMMRQYRESPAMRAIEEYRNSPAMRAIEEYRNSPAMRAIEEYRNSPAMRALEELQNSPTMQAIREIHARVSILDKI